jgi:phosphatidylethanolamine-binding protein (PEBP) family uncharacterized protein
MKSWRRKRSLRRGLAVSLSVGLPVALAGCGGNGGAATAGSQQAPIAFTSPSMAGGQAQGEGKTIPVRYTCDGSNTTPSFAWGVVPPNTAQLALFLFKLGRSTPTGNGNVRVEIKLEWAVGGLSSSIHRVPAGKLPRGAIPANGRYSICPPKGSAAAYLFQINALSHPLAVKPHFNAGKLLQESETATLASGTFTSSYKRL